MFRWLFNHDRQGQAPDSVYVAPLQDGQHPKNEHNNNENNKDHRNSSPHGDEKEKHTNEAESKTSTMTCLQPPDGQGAKKKDSEIKILKKKDSQMNIIKGDSKLRMAQKSNSKERLTPARKVASKEKQEKIEPAKKTDSKERITKKDEGGSKELKRTERGKTPKAQKENTDSQKKIKDDSKKGRKEDSKVTEKKTNDKELNSKERKAKKPSTKKARTEDSDGKIKEKERVQLQLQLGKKKSSENLSKERKGTNTKRKKTGDKLTVEEKESGNGFNKVFNIMKQLGEQEKSGGIEHKEGGDKEDVDLGPEWTKLFAETSRQLCNCAWYHGLMPRSDCEKAISNNGDFLVRKSTAKGIPIYVVTIKWNNEYRHKPFSRTKDEMWELGEVKKKTIPEIVELFVDGLKELPPTGALFKKAVPRPPFLIMHEDITIKTRLGAGAFGEVFTGSFRKSPAEEVDCAVKKLKHCMDKVQLNSFINEGNLMRKFEHQNIVRVYGVATQEEPVMIILELAVGGTIKHYFNKHPEDNWDQMLTFTRDAVRGMTYLSQRKVIHRDLAARNCLLGSKNELKISDFGLSVSASEIKLNKLKSMPIKWLAPETLIEGIFTTKTDVWSFGVLMWEIFTKCLQDPFPGQTNANAADKIRSGQEPMQLPSGAPPQAIAVIKLCFTAVAEQRPDFEAIFKLLLPNEDLPLPKDVVQS